MPEKSFETPRDSSLSENLKSALKSIKATIESQLPEIKLSFPFVKELTFSIGAPVCSDWRTAILDDSQRGSWIVVPSKNRGKEPIAFDESARSNLLLAIKTTFENLKKARGVKVRKVSITLCVGEKEICEKLGIKVHEQEDGSNVAELDFTLAAKLGEHRGSIAAVFGALVVIAGVATAASRRGHGHDSDKVENRDEPDSLV